MIDDEQLQTSKTLDFWLFEQNDMPQPTSGQIHVLVVTLEGDSGVEVQNVERDAKRQKVDENVSLEKLWKYSEMKMTALPPLNELCRRFFNDHCRSNWHCGHQSGLATRMARSLPVDWMASKYTWQIFYDLLLNISMSLCHAKGFRVSSGRNGVDYIEPTTKNVRPDFFLHYIGMLLLRGEDKDALTHIDVPCNELFQKMRYWNPIVYGDLPYTLGYATSGEQLRVLAIDRHLHAHVILDFLSIRQQQEEVIKTFYNLPFLLHKMTILSKRKYPSPLMPFTPDVNDKREIELINDVIRRTIKREQCRDEMDFKRLADIYTTLQDLNNRVREKTYLQTVRKLNLKDDLLCVRLSPLGCIQPPQDVDQVREWLRCMLTALKYWHSCHGDVRWPNILYDPTSDSGYWILIDMDESRKPNTTTIDWNHKFNGHTLNFQHDLYQLGKLMNTFLFTLPNDLVDFQTKLLSAVDTPVFTAEAALTLLLDQEHH
ncbi:hypothetical protein PR002_g13069 [Phytophthora rubi]|nr:hypothetical protein PR002_g13069 [Phytophthora rubi]